MKTTSRKVPKQRARAQAARPRRKKKRGEDSFVPVALREDATPATNWDALPLNLTITEVSEIERASPWTIRKRIKAHDFPEPDRKYPYLWKRDRFRAWFEAENLATSRPPSSGPTATTGRRPRNMHRTIAMR